MQKHRFGTAGIRRHKRIYDGTDRLLQCAGWAELNSLLSRKSR